jgi:hypothetical protein
VHGLMKLSFNRALVKYCFVYLKNGNVQLNKFQVSQNVFMNVSNGKSLSVQ